MRRAKPIPRELLFGNPERSSPKISPDGRRLSWLAPDDGVLNIWAGPVGGEVRPLTKDRGRGIRNYLWAEDGRSLLYIQDKDGDENWHLHQTDCETGATRDLTAAPGAQAQIVATDPRFPHEILISLNERDKRLHDVYRLDLRSGERRLIAENPGNVTGWLADSTFAVRAARAMRPDGGVELLVRDAADGPWRSFLSWGPDEQGGAHGFAPGDRSLYVESSDGTDTTWLWEIGLDGKTKTLLSKSAEADLGFVLLHPMDSHAEAVWRQTDRIHWEVLDPALAPDFEALAKIGDADIQLVSRDDADTTWIVLANSDRKPPAYWRYERKTRRAELLFSTRPALEAYELAPMKPVLIPARDGLRLHAYLSTPPGAGVERLPLVLLVHGGPWARDGWGYHPEAQWLANQGYAVLQVNFRGSTGFGKSFLHAGDRQWGAKMQDDLTDAVNWAVREGVADPQRVAIYGGSYGGYAALAGAAFTPELYRCAVSVVGPSNLATLIRSIPPYWEPMRRIFDLRVGNVDTEPDFLKSRSPLFFADKIRIPMMIAQGANDPRVKQAESEMIVGALRAAGKEPEYLLFPDEGHGFARPENRLKFYAAAESFLAKHLSPSPSVAAAR